MPSEPEPGAGGRYERRSLPSAHSAPRNRSGAHWCAKGSVGGWAAAHAAEERCGGCCGCEQCGYWENS